jgi:hypothetical protein
MAYATWQDLHRLAEHERPGSVSFYVGASLPSQPLKARLTEHRNTLASLRSQLEHLGWSVGDIDKVTETIDMNAQPEIDRSGTALFITEDAVEVYSGLASVPSLAIVASRFHLLPLVAVADRPQFFVLSLSLGDVRLYDCGPDGNLVPAGVGEIPESMDAALAFDDRESALTSHSGGRAGGAVTPRFHGQGGTSDARMKDMQRFLRSVSEAVTPIVGQSLVILAGTDTIVAAYRHEAAHDLAPEHLQPSPRRGQLRDLELRAHSAFERQRLAERQAVAQRVLSAAATSGGSLENETIAEALAEGRVEHLVLAADHHRWTSNGGTSVGAGATLRGPSDHDLLNDFAVDALRAGVTTTVVEPDALTGADAGAVFRY